MKNKEKYAKEMAQIEQYGKIALSGGKPAKCNITKCTKCERYRLEAFSGIEFCSDLKFLEWADSEYVEQQVDWSKVPVDTKVLVRDSESDRWLKKYFAKFEYGKVHTFTGSATSWNGVSTIAWEYAKLAEE